MQVAQRRLQTAFEGQRDLSRSTAAYSPPPPPGNNDGLSSMSVSAIEAIAERVSRARVGSDFELMDA